MRKILRQPLLNAAIAACGVIDKSDPTPTLPRRGRWRTLRTVRTVVPLHEHTKVK